MVGIVSYGVYIPRFRIKTEEIARAWRKSGKEVGNSLGVVEKAVPESDEDAVTLAIEAAKIALAAGPIHPQNLEALLVGSESHPYAVNPTSTIVGELLGVGNKYLAADLEFACKAGTAAIEAIAGLIQSRQITYGMAIGSDTAQSKPHDVLEYTSAAAAAAYILGSQHTVANLLRFSSYSSDTPDFWRRDGIRYPSHAGRFTGEPAYFAHVLGAARELLAKVKLKPSDIDYCVFHMPNGKFPREAARRLGFTLEQLRPSLVVENLGNPYSSSSLIGLAAVLDYAKPKSKIFMVSYGSGAGSDAFLWEVTEEIVRYQTSVFSQKNAVKEQLEQKTYIDYTQYLQMTHKI